VERIGVGGDPDHNDQQQRRKRPFPKGIHAQNH
jgi:hypothetical protein